MNCKKFFANTWGFNTLEDNEIQIAKRFLENAVTGKQDRRSKLSETENNVEYIKKDGQMEGVFDVFYKRPKSIF